MAEADKKGKTQPPKGGRRGGTIYPRVNLQDALKYSEKLVAKTHTGAQAADSILKGVFDNAGAGGKIRASALKQFGLLGGDASAYTATQLAKDILAATPEERNALVQKALLNSRLFSLLFDTFHGDETTRAKLKQRALQLGVHPESADEAINLFVESATTSKLGTVEGDTITLASKTPEGAGNLVEQESENDDHIDPNIEESQSTTGAPKSGDKDAGAQRGRAEVGIATKAGLAVTLNVDSSSDPDKLQKQLELLRKFGVI